MNINFFINDIPSDFLLEGDLAIDTEAMGLKIKRDRLCLIQICDSKGKICLVHFPNESFDYEKCINLKKYLLDENRQKIFHFARFDVAIMKYYLKLESIPNIFCTKIASRFARTYTDSHGLRSIVYEILGEEISKEQQSSNWGSNTLSEAQKNYAASDVIYLHQLRNKLIEMLKECKRLDIVEKYSNFINIVTTADLMDFTEDMFSHGFIRKSE